MLRDDENAFQAVLGLSLGTADTAPECYDQLGAVWSLFVDSVRPCLRFSTMGDDDE